MESTLPDRAILQLFALKPWLKRMEELQKSGHMEELNDFEARDDGVGARLSLGQKGGQLEVRTTAGMIEPAMDCASQRDNLEMPR